MCLFTLVGTKEAGRGRSFVWAGVCFGGSADIGGRFISANGLHSE